VFGLTSQEPSEIEGQLAFIKIQGRSWDLYYSNCKQFFLVFKSGDGQIRFNSLELNKKYLQIYLKSVFEKISDLQMKNISQIFELSLELKHGTIIVFDQYASAEIDRLKNRCIKAIPIPFSKELINQLSSIDGAIFFDFDCKCHGFGAILDGMANLKIAERGRGSRFNSAKAYINSRSSLAFAIVISDDGYFDFIN
jgi:hypothetical protein